jgi:hypothetical protein
MNLKEKNEKQITDLQAASVANAINQMMELDILLRSGETEKAQEFAQSSTITSAVIHLVEHFHNTHPDLDFVATNLYQIAMTKKAEIEGMDSRSWN